MSEVSRTIEVIRSEGYELATQPAARGRRDGRVRKVVRSRAVIAKWVSGISHLGRIKLATLDGSFVLELLSFLLRGEGDGAGHDGWWLYCSGGRRSWW